MNKPKIRVFGKTTVIFHPEGYCDVILPDNVAFTACPQKDQEYADRAIRLGYGIYANPIHHMNMEHDAMHALLAAVLGLDVSPALHATGHGIPIDDLTGAEEDLVLAAQRFVNLCRARGLLPK